VVLARDWSQFVLRLFYLQVRSPCYLQCRLRGSQNRSGLSPSYESNRGHSDSSRVAMLSKLSRLLLVNKREIGRMVSSGILRRVALVRTDVSEEPSLLHQGDKNR
jgi:hypothetical protein